MEYEYKRLDFVNQEIFNLWEKEGWHIVCPTTSREVKRNLCIRNQVLLARPILIDIKEET